MCSKIKRWHLVCFGTFLILSVLYAQRTSVSVAAEAMQDGLDWTDNQKNTFLGSFYYGYVALMLPGGELVRRYGGYVMLGIAIFFSSLFTAAIPIAATIMSSGRIFGFMCFLRALTGAVEALSFPAIYSIISLWVPYEHASSATGLIFGAEQFGSIIGFGLTGVVSQKVGWQSSFYIFGIFGGAMSALWLLCFPSNPLVDEAMSEEERQYILSSSRKLSRSSFSAMVVGDKKEDDSYHGLSSSIDPIDQKLDIKNNKDFYEDGTNDVLSESLIIHESRLKEDRVEEDDVISESVRGCVFDNISDDKKMSIAIESESRDRATPWYLIATSALLYPIYLQHFANNYMSYTLLTELPSYMSDSLGFDLESSGFVLVGLYLLAWCGNVFGGIVADKLSKSTSSIKITSTPSSSTFSYQTSMLPNEDKNQNQHQHQNQTHRPMLSVRNTRILMQCLAMMGSAFFLAAAAYQQTTVAILGMMYTANFFLGMGTGGWRSSFVDVSPHFASAVYAYSNTIANIPGFVVPLVTQYLTNGEATQQLGWHSVFVFTSCLNLFAVAVWPCTVIVEPLPGL